jgi:8-hydroxy-5-deazaflavin:NADPH oxidoreductase
MDLDKERDMPRSHATDRGRRNFLQLAGCGLGALALAAGPARVRAQTAAASPLKIGMVGAGRMGGALGALFVKAGHPVMFSSRHPENLKDLATRLGPLAQAGSVEQAVAFGDVVAMVVPYAALEEIGKAHGRVLATKPLVMDVCNPIARRDGEALVKWVAEQGGAGLASVKLLPGARIVRAFNGISYRRVGEIAHRPGGLVGVPIAGDDAKAIALAEGIIRGIGFEPVLVGGLAMGKYLLPGTPLAEEHTPAEIRQIAAGLR